MTARKIAWDSSSANPIADLTAMRDWLRATQPTFRDPDEFMTQLKEHAIAFEEVNGFSPNAICIPVVGRKTRRDRWMKEVRRSGRRKNN